MTRYKEHVLAVPFKVAHPAPFMQRQLQVHLAVSHIPLNNHHSLLGHTLLGMRPQRYLAQMQMQAAQVAAASTRAAHTCMADTPKGGHDHHHHHQPCWAGPGPGLPNNATSAVTAAGTVGAAVPQRHCSCAAQQGQLAAWGRSTCTVIHMHVDVHHAPCMWAPPRVLCIASSAAACVLSDGEQSGVLKHC